MKKINNKVLFIIIIGLAAVFALSRVFRSPKLEGNIRKDLVELDSSKITEIRIAAPDQTPIIVQRQDGKWMVRRGELTFEADVDRVNSTLLTLKSLRADRMVTRKEEKWADFKVDTTGIEVSIFAGSDNVADVWIGKTGFNQGAANQFGQPSINPFTYVRLNGESEVYVINSFVSVGSGLNDWRNKALVRMPVDKIAKIAFTYPADSSYVLEKRDTIWNSGPATVKRQTVSEYLGSIGLKNMTTFSDIMPTGSPLMSVEFSTPSGTACKVDAWKDETGWIVTSTVQPGVYFTTQGNVPDRELFLPRSKFNLR